LRIHTLNTCFNQYFRGCDGFWKYLSLSPLSYSSFLLYQVEREREFSFLHFPCHILAIVQLFLLVFLSIISYCHTKPFFPSPVVTDAVEGVMTVFISLLLLLSTRLSSAAITALSVIVAAIVVVVIVVVSSLCGGTVS
jgi:hypothetical protein